MTDLTRTDIADLIEDARSELPTPDVAAIYASHRKRQRNRRGVVGFVLASSVLAILFAVGNLSSNPELLETVSPTDDEAAELAQESLRELVVSEVAWFVTRDVGFDQSNSSTLGGEVLERVDFASIDGQSTIQLSSRCPTDVREIDWTNNGFVVGEVLVRTTAVNRCGDEDVGNEFATRPIPIGSEITVTLVAEELVLSNNDPSDPWTLTLFPIAVGLPNEIGQQLVDSHGWQYTDGAGDFDRTGVSFSAEGADESIRFSSDDRPLDVITLVTGCNVASYKIEWTGTGFEIVSAFVTNGPLDSPPCGPQTDGVVTTPLAIGVSVLVTTDNSGEVTLGSSDPNFEWRLILTVPPTN